MECADLRTNLDPAAVIRERASQLYKHGFLQPGQEMTVQVLADATGLWKKGREVNVTALVPKIIYDDTAGTRLAGHTVNSVANNKLLCLYVGDDCYSNMKEYVGDIPEKLRLIAEEGVTVDGVHSTVPCCLIRKWFRVFSEMVFWEIQNGFFGTRKAHVFRTKTVFLEKYPSNTKIQTDLNFESQGPKEHKSGVSSEMK